jgi:SAM-dependent methyltransferase
MTKAIQINDAARRQIESRHIPVLELGCGPAKRASDSIGVDIVDYPGVDIIGDVFAALERLPAGSVDCIYASHFFEHVEDLSGLLAACVRVLIPEGLLEVTVPHFSNPYFYSDYTHKRAFGLYSMSYLSHDSILKRKVPQYQNEPELVLADVKLRFKSAFKYSIRNIMFHGIEPFVNSTRYTQEVYEEIFSKYIPCYEVTYYCRKRRPAAA